MHSHHTLSPQNSISSGGPPKEEFKLNNLTADVTVLPGDDSPATTGAGDKEKDKPADWDEAVSFIMEDRCIELTTFRG